MSPAPTTRRHLLCQGLAWSAPAWLPHARAADVNPFELGVASGFPSPDGMVLWTLLGGPNLPEVVPVSWEVARDELFRQVVARGTEQARATEHWSVHAEPAGLEPGRWYWYRFQALGQQSPVGRTRTAPAPGAAAELSLVLASCQRYDAGHYAAWRQAVQDDPDLILFVGDYIYEYASRPDAPRRHAGGLVRSLDDYRQRWGEYKRDPLLQAAHATAPWLFVWDDHEVDNDYAGLQGQGLQSGFAAQRAAAYQACWEHLPMPKRMRPVQADARIYGHWDWGRLARILLLDDRQYRDPQVCPKPGRGGSNTVTLKDCPALRDAHRSLLGSAQERWLSESWDAQKTWNLLGQQTLMAPFSWTDPGLPEGGTWWTDGWDGYAASRQRILDELATRKVKGAVVLGGDVHSHYVADLRQRGHEGPVVASEFCGSSITSPSMAQSRIDRALGFNPHVHYGRSDQRGYVHLQLTDKALTARLMAVDDALDPLSPVRVAARFAIDPGQAGIHKA